MNVSGVKKGNGPLKHPKRLIAFGCSFTYGQGLPDSIVGNNYDQFSLTPSNLAWPKILGEMTDREVINLGKPGASNLEILYHILNFNFKPNDQVIIMWSLTDRDLYFISNTKKIKPFRQLGLWASSKSSIVAEWISKFNPVDNCIKSWLYLQHADLYLKTTQVKYIHYPAFPKNLLENKPDFIKTIDNFFDHGFVVIDYSNIDTHPGINSHIETAKKIYSLINEQSK